jgi:hypothetical protein
MLASTGPAEAALMLAALPGVVFLPTGCQSKLHGAIDMGLARGLLPGWVGLDDGRSWYGRRPGELGRTKPVN